ncbi:type VII secretion integral membrane protein EccD [Actinosynnema pretiosum subsp. pretiosum]|uniref:Secretion protein snm4 n=2 Tax=Actinosynnema TaxID=40566 RepID=C6WLY6_ACTMD|nr:type VII secretion integral membrane protein EccD [Actinosynnema mirum]ACU40371.1 secretion protein snm4 [Actinosynnema mirum DSM 43827]AXX33882.1 putative membrane protein [Actinosynnema pretiosum subsp. pretiosum]QUF02361.1 type VII secretion integral membrane protein EccD [Actinosynnema pretiosum subsp. pretiosum]
MATGTTVFSRVTVVAPRTRIDVALPADVAVADLLPMLLDMAKEATPDGGVRHGGWCLAKLGDSPLDPGRTLASLGVVDGELLQLRKRNENPPPPLYDDVVDAIAESDPDSYRPWTKETARKYGHIAGALGLAAAAVAVLLAGPVGGGTSLAAAISAGIAAIVAIAAGTVVARSYSATGTGVLIVAAGSLPMAYVAGLYAVPGPVGMANLLLASVLVLIFAAVAILLIGRGITVFIAAATAGALSAVAFLIGLFVEHPMVGIAAATSAVSLAALSALPRLTIQLAKLPLPMVPTNAEDLKEDTGFPEYAVIERRTANAHEYLTGMIIGCGSVAALFAVIAAGDGTVFGPILAIVVTLVLLLRGRAYANGAQAVALLVSGMFAGAGVLVGWLVQSSPGDRLLFVFGALILVGAVSLVLGVIFPQQKFSPVLRRTVDVLEAILIAAVLPLALAVMDMYVVMRQLLPA